MAAKKKQTVPTPNDHVVRPYTGNVDGPHPARREGTYAFLDLLRFFFQVKSLGVYANRPVRGGISPSTHRTHRALDIEGGPNQLKAIATFLEANNDRLGVELVADYSGARFDGLPYGALWRCDRNAWTIYDKPTINGKKTTLHIEINPEMADSPDLVRAAWTSLWS